MPATNRSRRPTAPASDGSDKDAKPTWPRDHSGEGSASALASLRKLEDSRAQPTAPQETDDGTAPTGS